MINFLRKNRTAMVILSFAVAAAFLPFVDHPFMTLDDNYLIYQNEAVKNFNVWYVFTHFDPQLYIPFTFLSWQINAALFGMNPFMFNLVNILLHAGNAILVYAILRKLEAGEWVALGVAMLFAVHPLQTEAVVWAAGRKDLLSAIFALGSLYQYLRYREGRTQALRWSLLLFTCALFSKVSIALLPFLMLAIDWVQRRPMDRRVVTEKLPFLGLIVVFVLIAVLGKSTELGSSGTIVNLLLPSKSVVFYLTKVFVPVGLTVIYPFTPPANLLAAFALTTGFVVLLGLAGLVLLYRRPSPALALSLFLFFLFLAPSFTTYWKNGYLYFASDRYAYLAVIGIFWLVVWAIEAVAQRLHAEWLTRAAVIALAVALVPVTWLQAEHWRSSEALYQHAVDLYPESVMAQTNLGMEWNDAGQMDKAKAAFEHAIQMDPTSTIAYFDLAAILGKQGDVAGQTALYEKVMEVLSRREINSGQDVYRFTWLIGKFHDLGKSDSALALAKKLTEVSPRTPEFWFAYGEELRSAGQDDLALPAFENARDHGSQNPKTYYHLAELYSAQGRTQYVIESLQESLQWDPSNQEAKRNLEMLTSGH